MKLTCRNHRNHLHRVLKGKIYLPDLLNFLDDTAEIKEIKAPEVLRLDFTETLYWKYYSGNFNDLLLGCSKDKYNGLGTGVQFYE